MRPIQIAFFGVAAFVLAGCIANVEERAAALVPEEDTAAAERALRAIFAGDASGARDQLHPSLDEEGRGSLDAWAQIVDVAAGADLEALDLIGVNVHRQGGSRTTNLTWEVETPEGWRVIAVAILDGTFYGVNVQATEGSLVEANRFRVEDAGLTHLILLLYCLGSVALSSLAALRVLQSDIPRRRLWAVLSFAMVGKAQLAWATGAVSLQLLAIHLPPVTITQGGSAAPLLIGFGFPLFALIALRKVSRVPRPADS